MEWIGLTVAYLIFRPFFSVCQALAGILHRTDSARLIRAQRYAVIVLILGSVLTAAALGSASFGVRFSICACFFISGAVLLSIAGAIGHHVEKSVNRENSDTNSSADEE